MNTFFLILSNMILNDTTSSDISILLRNQSLIHILFYLIFYRYVDNYIRNHNTHCIYACKYCIFNNIVLKNIFISESIKDDCIHTFGIIQKHYCALNRVAYLWKWKRANSPITTDLYFNTLNPEKAFNIILYQNGVKYSFRISDLLKCMEQKLTNCDYEFNITSEYPINPYNKLEFSKTILYNIHFHIYFSKMKVPLFLELFFQENFNIAIFNTKHDTYLRKLAIRNYCYNEPYSESLFREVDKIMKSNMFTRKLKIHDDFPKPDVVNAMRPYLYVYYLTIFGNLEYDLEEFYDNTLFYQLREFYKHNPLYGRKIYVMHYKNKISDFAPDISCSNISPFLEKTDKSYFVTDHYYFNTRRI